MATWFRPSPTTQAPRSERSERAGPMLSGRCRPRPAHEGSSSALFGQAARSRRRQPPGRRARPRVSLRKPNALRWKVGRRPSSRAVAVRRPSSSAGRRGSFASPHGLCANGHIVPPEFWVGVGPRGVALGGPTTNVVDLAASRDRGAPNAQGEAATEGPVGLTGSGRSRVRRRMHEHGFEGTGTGRTILAVLRRAVPSPRRRRAGFRFRARWVGVPSPLGARGVARPERRPGQGGSRTGRVNRPTRTTRDGEHPGRLAGLRPAWRAPRSLRPLPGRPTEGSRRGERESAPVAPTGGARTRPGRALAAAPNACTPELCVARRRGRDPAPAGHRARGPSRGRTAHALLGSGGAFGLVRPGCRRIGRAG